MPGRFARESPTLPAPSQTGPTSVLWLGHVYRVLAAILLPQGQTRRLLRGVLQSRSPQCSCPSAAIGTLGRARTAAASTAAGPSFCCSRTRSLGQAGATAAICRLAASLGPRSACQRHPPGGTSPGWTGPTPCRRSRFANAGHFGGRAGCHGGGTAQVFGANSSSDASSHATSVGPAARVPAVCGGILHRYDFSVAVYA